MITSSNSSDTGPTAPVIEDIDDLSGRKLLVHFSSSYCEHLERINQDLSERGLQPIVLEPAPKGFEDADLLKMVDAGILPYAVTESRKAAIWSQLLRHIKVREDLAIHRGGQIAWAFRKKSPELKALLDAFAAEHKQGTLHGNILVNRYLKDSQRLRQTRGWHAYDRYFSQQSMDNTNKVLFTIAAYNAGPARIAALREQAAEEGLDPDIWFNNVETIAAKRIGPVPGQYLRNIYSYYLAYRLVMSK